MGGETSFDRHVLREWVDAHKKKGKNQTWLAATIGKSEAAVSQWLNGKDNPNVDSVVSIAQATGIPLNRLLGVVDPDRAGEVAWIPLFGSVQAGPNGDAGDQVQIVEGEWSRGGYNVPESLIKRRRRGSVIGCVVVEGDSMEPFPLSGDIVLVEVARKWEDARNGDMVIVDLTGSGEYVVKRLAPIKGDVRNKLLVSANGKYDPIIVRKCMRIFGVVVAIHRPMI
jgi:SOS-response transcriptional repressor LexA